MLNTPWNISKINIRSTAKSSLPGCQLYFGAMSTTPPLRAGGGIPLIMPSNKPPKKAARLLLFTEYPIQSGGDGYRRSGRWDLSVILL